ncbi:hypothetical protein ACHAXM_000628 [Skeletonema potamos]
MSENRTDRLDGSITFVCAMDISYEETIDDLPILPSWLVMLPHVEQPTASSSGESPPHLHYHHLQPRHCSHPYRRLHRLESFWQAIG